jgi:ssDNA-binding Zn-finger/Zn-ribbon topoisomerase 1
MLAIALSRGCSIHQVAPVAAAAFPISPRAAALDPSLSARYYQRNEDRENRSFRMFLWDVPLDGNDLPTCTFTGPAGYMKKEDIPLEHPSFHRETMLGGAGIFGFALFWVAVLGLMTHYDYQNKILSGLGVGFFILSAFWLMAYFWHRAFSAKPNCPKCNTRVASPGIGIEYNGSRWQVHNCPQCGESFRIPGMSAGGA